jgi:carboxymethylenebutenolidase
MPRLLVPLAVCLLAGCAAPAPAPPEAPREAAAETLSFASGKETVSGLVYRPAGAGPFPAVVVVHGDFGLTDAVKERARRLADHGFLALAVDLYRGEPVGDLMDAHILGRGLPDERVLADLKGAVDHLSERPDVRGGAVGILGWDMGGGYALDAARHDPRLRAVVTCSGRLTTDPSLLAPLNAPVLGVFAGKDEGIPPETIKQFRAAMRNAGKRVAGIHVYPDCEPGFLLADGPPSPEAADAWQKIERFLGAELLRRSAREAAPDAAGPGW